PTQQSVPYVVLPPHRPPEPTRTTCPQCGGDHLGGATLNVWGSSGLFGPGARPDRSHIERVLRSLRRSGRLGEDPDGGGRELRVLRGNPHPGHALERLAA